MFSIMTIASSTIKPAEIVNPISEMLSMLYPPAYMTPNVATSDRGTARLGITVAHKVRKNRKITTTTRLIVSIIVNCTSRIDARVVCDRSDIRSTWTAGGSDCSSLGINAWTRSTTSIVLGAGGFWGGI